MKRCMCRLFVFQAGGLQCSFYFDLFEAVLGAGRTITSGLSSCITIVIYGDKKKYSHNERPNPGFSKVSPAWELNNKKIGQLSYGFYV